MAPPPKCLYETLQISTSATDAEIKKAYRIQALAHHPDKNPDRQEQAEETFKAIQHAYGVLSDPHERAWYDAHRDQILRGKDPVSGESQPSSATEANLFAYFSNSAWKGYDGEGGFYNVFETLFEQLWREETAASHKEKARPAPKFGNASTPWEEVRSFYQEWEPFSSSKSFAFGDKWNLADAPNREYRRAMEKENKKQRAKFKKEFNNNVRELVKFVKKRDPRVIKRREQEEKEREEREEARKQNEEMEKEKKRDEAQRVKEAREAVLEEDADALDEILAGIALDEKIERRKQRRRARGTDDDGDDDTPDDDEQNDDSDVDEHDQFSSEEELVEDLYCIACKKVFRTAAQRADHERSKKHKAATAKMKRQVLQEEEQFVGEGEKSDTDAQGMEDNVAADEGYSASAASSKSKKKRKRKARMQSYSSLKEDGAEEGQGLADHNANSERDEKEEGRGDAEAEPKEKVLSKKEKRKLREEKKKAAAAVHKCNVCSEQFPSRSKLMKHVNDVGHALHVERRR
ncbi:DnaJ-like [Gracilariopsis chorda]|uniref:DnaJ-like n=1 Tax=Gracilariopsis chorda TaxID=448386 RepID=A0A2V3IZZ3_9FLOR|nr:DnaJ-like [Gracilariopsis chorda]|eukprot:PXF47736.1 DnaJ-like [Gracilariopsis chorda]